MKILFKKVGVAVLDKTSYEPKHAIDDLKPTPILKTCIPPCKGETNCMRICARYQDRAYYPDIAAENLKACYIDPENHSHTCEQISTQVAETLFGGANGRFNIKFS